MPFGTTDTRGRGLNKVDEIWEVYILIFVYYCIWSYKVFLRAWVGVPGQQGSVKEARVTAPVDTDGRVFHPHLNSKEPEEGTACETLHTQMIPPGVHVHVSTREQGAVLSSPLPFCTNFVHSFLPFFIHSVCPHLSQKPVTTEHSLNWSMIVCFHF